VQGIDLATALVALLFQHAPGQEQRPYERFPQIFIPDNTPLDVADDTAEIGLELAGSRTSGDRWRPARAAPASLASAGLPAPVRCQNQHGRNQERRDSHVRIEAPHRALPANTSGDCDAIPQA
jgi:hypothetical protein